MSRALLVVGLAALAGAPHASPVCVTYDPVVLTTAQVTPNEWELRARGNVLDRLRTQVDAAHALEVARHFTQHCWLGPPSDDRSTENWGPTAQSFTASFHEDCQIYHPDRLQMFHSQTAWYVGEPDDHGRPGAIKMFENETDAGLGLSWLAKNAQECWIGRREASTGNPIPQVQRTGHVLFYGKK